jgi:hypothetical protein
MKFITWFKQSLEDELGEASFKRIYNWLIICLVIFVTIYCTLNNLWSTPTLWVLAILLTAGFLNTGVITVENIIKFKNGGTIPPDAQAIADKLQVNSTIEPKPETP